MNKVTPCVPFVDGPDVRAVVDAPSRIAHPEVGRHDDSGRRA